MRETKTQPNKEKRFPSKRSWLEGPLKIPTYQKYKNRLFGLKKVIKTIGPDIFSTKLFPSSPVKNSQSKLTDEMEEKDQNGGGDVYSVLVTR